MAPTLAVTTAGTRRQLLVLTGDAAECMAVDVMTGALVRAHTANGHRHPVLKTYDLVSVQFARHPEVPDPAQPEAVTLEGLPEPAGRLKARLVRRHLDDLVTPPGGPLFGFPGPATPYWTLTGANPSVAVVRPEGDVVAFVRRGEEVVRASFRWGRAQHHVPIYDLGLATRLAPVLATPRTAGRSVEEALGFPPSFVLIALTPPRSGHCYKTVAAFLPKP